MSEGWSYYLDFKNQMFELEAGEQTVGRSRTCDISVNDPSVSRRHVVLKADSGSILIKDLGSSNGTFVNGERIQESGELHHGDSLGLGDADLSVRIIGTSAFKTVRMAAHPLEPEHGEATLFLQKASADLAQEAMELDSDAGPGHMAPPPPGPSHMAPPEPPSHMAPPAPEPHMAPPPPEPRVAPPEPENSPTQEVTAEASFSNLLDPEPEPAAPSTPAPAQTVALDDIAVSTPAPPGPPAPAPPVAIEEAMPPVSPAPPGPPAQPAAIEEAIPPLSPAPPGPPAQPAAIEEAMPPLSPAPPGPPAQPAEARQAAPQPAAPRPTPPAGVAVDPPAHVAQSVPSQQAAPEPPAPQASPYSPPVPAAPEPPTPAAAPAPAPTSPTPAPAAPATPPPAAPQAPVTPQAADPQSPGDVRLDQTTGDLLPSLDGFDVTMGPEMMAAVKTEKDEQPTTQTPAYNPYSAPTPQAQGSTAGFGIRLLAALVDGIWMAALQAGAAFAGLGLSNIIMSSIASGIGLIVVLFGWAIWGTTPGKRVFNLYVTAGNGAQAGIGFPRALARIVGYVASTIPVCIGFLMIIFNKSNRGLHDMIAGTEVRRQ